MMKPYDLTNSSLFTQSLVALTADVFTAASNTKGAWIIMALARHTGPGAQQNCILRIKTDNIDIFGTIATPVVNTLIAMPNPVFIPASKAVECVTGDKCEMRVVYRLL